MILGMVTMVNMSPENSASPNEHWLKQLALPLTRGPKKTSMNQTIIKALSLFLRGWVSWKFCGTKMQHLSQGSVLFMLQSLCCVDLLVQSHSLSQPWCNFMVIFVFPTIMTSKRLGTFKLGRHRKHHALFRDLVVTHAAATRLVWRPN